MKAQTTTFGIIGGLGTLSGGDLFFKLLKSKTVLANQQNFHFLFEQHPYQQINSALENESDVSSRKFYAYNVCKGFEDKKVDKVLLPCFASHTFINELQTELTLPVINLMDAVRAYLDTRLEKGAKIGLLASNFVRDSTLFRSYLKDFQICYPDSQAELMDLVYSEHGIKKGYLDGVIVEKLDQICQQLLREGCSVILPGITELSLLAAELCRRGIEFVDVNQLYADYAIDSEGFYHETPFKLGILGGVGPAATVDFMTKVVKNTPAQKDQDRIKMIVEQNPQIPDRTANLLHNESDPTIAMFSTCKRLEVQGAQAIAIPCNTAHAFVDRIQPHLKIPIVNMLNVTIEHIVGTHGTDITVGLAATSGTLQSRVYHHIASAFNLDLIEPDAEHQQYVMESIYGESGVKAGFFQGECLQNIARAICHLADRGADVVILGCTELPIMFAERSAFTSSQGKQIPLVDPTAVLARKCVAIALEKRAATPD